MAIPCVRERLTALAWEEAHCPLCGPEAASHPILLRGRPLTEGQFGYTVNPRICGCGLVYLAPRWTAATYTAFYRQFYDPLYRLELKEEIGKEGVRRNMQTVWKRMAPHVADRPAVHHVLDVGCGSGYGFEALRPHFPQASFYGIEASEDCLRALADAPDVTLVADDVNGRWAAAYLNFFDVVVMRHVMEHFLDPVASLGHVAATLAPHGVAYLSMPDTMHPRLALYDYTNWWEYYFRAVHPFYYNIDTAAAAIRRAGLHLIAWAEEDHELWLIAGKAPNGGYKPQYSSTDQADRLHALLPQR